MVIYGNTRNKYTKEFEDFVRIIAPTTTKEDLRCILEKRYKLTITKNSLGKYLYRHHIRCIDYNKTKAREMNKKPIGYEYVKDDGMVLVKVAQPNKWEYKQRVLYKMYHNCKLTSDDYIIFLNQDRTDFSKDNLKRITRRESAIISNQKMFSKDKKLTNLGILTSKVIIKTKEVDYVKRI